MKKYYLANYDRRMGGDFCEIYNVDLERVEIVRGVCKIDGLQEIAKRGSITAASYEVEDIGGGFVRLVRSIDGAAPLAAAAVAKN